MRTELSHIFVADKAKDIFPSYPKLCAANGANVAVQRFGVTPRIGFIARTAIFVLTAVKPVFQRFYSMTDASSAGAPAIRDPRRWFCVRPITLRGPRK